MQVFASKKVLDQLPFTVEQWDEEENLFFSWHANIIMVNRRKVLLFINEVNRYTIALFGVKAKDLKRIDELLIESIRAGFLAERIPVEVVEHYIEEAGKVLFHKSKNRKMLGNLNQAAININAICAHIPIENQLVNVKLNQ